MIILDQGIVHSIEKQSLRTDLSKKIDDKSEGACYEAPKKRLSKREIEILQLITQGYTSKKIANGLYISHRTVERHIENIKIKLNAKTKYELVAIAYRDGSVF